MRITILKVVTSLNNETRLCSYPAATVSRTTSIPKVLKVLVVSFENEEGRELECRARGEWRERERARENFGIRREVDW